MSDLGWPGRYGHPRQSFHRHNLAGLGDNRIGPDILCSLCRGIAVVAFQGQINTLAIHRDFRNPHPIIIGIHRCRQIGGADPGISQPQTVRGQAHFRGAQFQPRNRAELMAFGAWQPPGNDAGSLLRDAQNVFQIGT